MLKGLWLVSFIGSCNLVLILHHWSDEVELSECCGYDLRLRGKLQVPKNVSGSVADFSNSHVHSGIRVGMSPLVP